MKYATSLILLTLLAFPVVADLDYTVNLTSDYTFRGVSQTFGDPAIQGSIDYSRGNFFVGTFVSNVKLIPHDGVRTEWTHYAGYTTSVSGHDVTGTVIRYTYPRSGPGVHYNYTEYLIDAVVNDNVSLSFGYSDDAYNTDGTGVYYGINYTKDVGNDVTFDSSLSWYDLSDAFGGSYNTWKIGVSKELDLGGFNLGNVSANYIVNGNDDNAIWGNAGDNRFVISTSYTF